MTNNRVRRLVPALSMLAVATAVVAAVVEPQRPIPQISAVTETRPAVGKD
jgi:hypothetical protein